MKAKIEEKIITKEEFLKAPKGKSECKILEVFKANPDKAFNYFAICKRTDYTKSAVYLALNNLIKTDAIEKRGEFYCLKLKGDEKE